MATRYTLDWYLERRRPAPKDKIAQWAVKNALPNFFLYELAGKEKEGQCTACKKEYTFHVGKNRYMDCPKCGRRIKAVEKTSDWWNGYDCWVSYLENYDGDYLLHRMFRVGRTIKGSKEQVQIEEGQMQVLKFPLKTNVWGCKYFTRETAYQNRTYFTCHGVVGSGPHNEYWERGVLGGFGHNVFQDKAYVYPKNLKETLKGTPFEYSCLWALAERSPFKIYNALMMYDQYPQLEYLIKLKMYKLAKGLIEHQVWGERKENNIRKFLKLQSQTQMNRIAREDLDVGEYRLMVEYQNHNLTETPGNRALCKQHNYFGDGIYRILDVMNADSFYDYYKSQKKVKFVDFIRDYLDHIRLVENLGLNINDTMYSKPKDFYAQHAAFSAEIAARKDKEKYAKVDKVLKTEKTYAFSFGALSLIVPTSAKEIVAEGKMQNHCVGTYLDRVLAKKSVIVFIRKMSDMSTPFYTMEINPQTMTVVQCRGFKNCAMTDEVKAFLGEYEKKVLGKKRKHLKKAA